MKNLYIDINWNMCNLNNEVDKNFINEIEEILNKYGYIHRIDKEIPGECVIGYYKDKTEEEK